MAIASGVARMAMSWRTVGRRLLGNREQPSRREGGKGGKGKKGASSLDEWPDGQDDQPSGEKPNEEVAGLFIGAVSRHVR